ncbi:putative apoptosis-inducing factor 1, mitochondrial isoform X2 [Teleopsis dalmanni]|uniref:putative apoptosis-inducing factor 1, mitochondrial isoform X2 n=1 Tax=Teleopsis dalmanni TaxID=139649 RepID=UPI0018CF2B20|nr:putative apoptosis-inducing factor 1, mitochondrial isoform X2 [Teleopsis dalmanni]
MSICVFRCARFKFCRRAVILANGNVPGTVGSRGAHNSLYQMDKNKRKLSLNTELLRGVDCKGRDTTSSYTGRDGTPCYTGRDGTPSYAGRDGTPCYAGRDGTPCYTGRDGTSSYTGRDGTPCYTGRDGTSSYTGRDGTSSYTGRDGTPCYTGRDSTSSYTGRDGTPSYTGRDGTSSYTGRDGTSSYTGRDGTSSYSGRDGTPSYSGRDGTSSYTGRDGTSSYTGRDGTSSYTGRDCTPSYTGRDGTSSYGSNKISKSSKSISPCGNIGEMEEDADPYDPCGRWNTSSRSHVSPMASGSYRYTDCPRSQSKSSSKPKSQAPRCIEEPYDPCKRPAKRNPCAKSAAAAANPCGFGGPDDGDGKDGDDCSKLAGSLRTCKILLGALAALGAGGLLYWLLSGDNDKDSGDKASAAMIGQQTMPLSSADLPNHVPYLLIGGGTASFSAFRAIKSNDPTAKVLMITNEFNKPYMRPPLSKELWYSAQDEADKKDYRFKQWTGAERSIFFEPNEFFVDPTKLMDSINGGIAVAQGFTVKRIDPAKRIAVLSDGYEIAYDECLIATGCAPKNLEVFSNAPPSVRERVMVYRSPEDFDRLKKYADARKNIAIIGNGFIGSELACSLANYSKECGMKVYQIFPESGNMSKILPDYLSKWTTKKVEATGVCVIPDSSVIKAYRDENSVKLKLNNGSIILTDIIVVCVGCEANTNMAYVSGLEVDSTLGGFVVNAELEARRNLFVAGDASCFYDPLLGRRRVEHHDHSVVSGRLAGENMVGKKKAYTHQSMFWSDLGPEIGYEGIGLVDSSLPTVGVFALPTKTDRKSDNLSGSNVEVNGVEVSNSGKDLPDVKCDINNADDYGRGVVFYLKNDKVVGILLWNLFNRIGLARTIITQNKKFDDLNEVAKLFEIHS